MATHNKQIVDLGPIKEIASHVFDSNTQTRIEIHQVMVHDDIIKETLQAQQKLLQKLYQELEAEREASETAANEALSVILRLQGEKAAIKMEAEQYRRLSEDKISQMEDSLAVMHELILRKEMEANALDSQVHAYRWKLLNMGWFDDHHNDDRLALEDDHTEKAGSSLCNKASDFDDFASEGAFESYSDMIKGLDNRVRDIVGVDYPSSSDIQCAVSDKAENLKNRKDRSKSVHDVFEVPQVEKSRVIVDDVLRPTSNCCKENLRGIIKNAPLVQHRSSDHRNVTSEIERADDSKGEEQLILLKQIKEQMISLQDEVRRLKANRVPIEDDDESLNTLREAMLYFWL